MCLTFFISVYNEKSLAFFMIFFGLLREESAPAPLAVLVARFPFLQKYKRVSSGLLRSVRAYARMVTGRRRRHSHRTQIYGLLASWRALFWLVFATRCTTSNNDVFFAVFCLIKKARHEMPVCLHFAVAHWTHAPYTWFRARIAVRASKNDAPLVIYRHRAKYARKQILFIERRSAERTIRKRKRFLFVC